MMPCHNVSSCAVSLCSPCARLQQVAHVIKMAMGLLFFCAGTKPAWWLCRCVHPGVILSNLEHIGLDSGGISGILTC